MIHFLNQFGRQSSSSEAEPRLIYRGLKSVEPEPAAGAPGSPEQQTREEALQKAIQETQQQGAAKTVNRIQGEEGARATQAVPEATAPVEKGEPFSRTKQSIAEVKESGSTVKKAAMTAAFVAVPPAAATAAAGIWGWKKLAKVPPFKWVDKGVRKVGSVAVEGVKSVGKVVAAPFKLATSAALDTVELSYNIVKKALDATVGELYRDTRYVLEHKLDLGKDKDGKDVNLLTATMMMGKAAVLFPFKLGGDLAKIALEHPIRTAIGGIITYAFLSNPVGTIAAGHQIVEKILGILHTVVNWGAVVPGV